MSSAISDFHYAQERKNIVERAKVLREIASGYRDFGTHLDDVVTLRNESFESNQAHIKLQEEIRQLRNELDHVKNDESIPITDRIPVIGLLKKKMQVAERALNMLESRMEAINAKLLKGEHEILNAEVDLARRSENIDELYMEEEDALEKAYRVAHDRIHYEAAEADRRRTGFMNTAYNEIDQFHREAQRQEHKLGESIYLQNLARTRVKGMAALRAEAEQALEDLQREKKEVALSNVLQLKSSMDQAYDHMVATNRVRKIQSDEKEKKRQSEYGSLLSARMNPYEVWRLEDRNEATKKVVSRHEKAINDAKMDVLRKTVVEDQKIQQQYQRQKLQEENIQDQALRGQNQIKDTTTSAYIMSRLVNGNDTIDPTGRMQEIHPSEVSLIRPRGFGIGRVGKELRGDILAKEMARPHMESSVPLSSWTKRAAAHPDVSDREAPGIAGEGFERLPHGSDGSPLDHEGLEHMVGQKTGGETKRISFADSWKNATDNLIPPSSAYDTADNDLSYDSSDSDAERLTSEEKAMMQRSILVKTKIKTFPDGKRNISLRPLSVYEQKLQKQALERQKALIAGVPQVVMGKAYTGAGFSATPEIVHFRDFEVGKMEIIEVTITNISFSFNSFRVGEIPDEYKPMFHVSHISKGRMSAGISTPVTIRFLPLAKVDIETFLPLYTALGLIQIPIRCSYRKALPSLVESILDFGNVTIGENKIDSLRIENSGYIPMKIFVKREKIPDEQVTTMRYDESDIDGMTGINSPTQWQGSGFASQQNGGDDGSLLSETDRSMSYYESKRAEALNQDKQKLEHYSSKELEIEFSPKEFFVLPSYGSVDIPFRFCPLQPGPSFASATFHFEIISDTKDFTLNELERNEEKYLEFFKKSEIQAAAAMITQSYKAPAPLLAVMQGVGDEAPIYVRQPILEFETCLLNKTYRSILCVFNRGTTSQKVTLKMHKGCIESSAPDVQAPLVPGSTTTLAIASKTDRKHVPGIVSESDLQQIVSQTNMITIAPTFNAMMGSRTSKNALRTPKPKQTLLKATPTVAYVQAREEASLQEGMAEFQFCFTPTLEMFKNPTFLEEGCWSINGRVITDHRELEDPFQEPGMVYTLQLPMELHAANQNLSIPFLLQARVSSGQIRVSTTMIDYGECLIGQATYKMVTITNMAAIPQKFGFVHDSKVFSISVIDGSGYGTLLPGESKELAFMYTPAIEHEQTETMKLLGTAGHVSHVRLIGRGKVPPISLSHPNVILSATCVGEENYTYVTVKNNTSEAIDFFVLIPPYTQLEGPPLPETVAQLLESGSISMDDFAKCDSLSIFPSSGVLYPKQSLHLRVLHKPKQSDSSKARKQLMDAALHESKESDEFLESTHDLTPVDESANLSHLPPFSAHKQAEVEYREWTIPIYVRKYIEQGAIVAHIHSTSSDTAALDGTIKHREGRHSEQDDSDHMRSSTAASFLSTVDTLARTSAKLAGADDDKINQVQEELDPYAVTLRGTVVERPTADETRWTFDKLQWKDCLVLRVVGAVIPSGILADTSNIAFGHVAIGSLAEKIITITNNLPVGVELIAQPLPSTAGFSVITTLQKLDPGESQKVHIVFRPLEHKISVATLRIGAVSQSSYQEISLSGVGVSPSAVIEPPGGGFINFGTLVLGDSVSRTVHLRNTSLFPISFKIMPVNPLVHSSFSDLSFQFSPEQGVISPQGKVNITITYKPQSVTPYSLLHGAKFVVRIPFQSEDVVQTFVLLGRCRQHPGFVVPLGRRRIPQLLLDESELEQATPTPSRPASGASQRAGSRASTPTSARKGKPPTSSTMAKGKAAAAEELPPEVTTILSASVSLYDSKSALCDPAYVSLFSPNSMVPTMTVLSSKYENAMNPEVNSKGVSITDETEFYILDFSEDGRSSSVQLTPYQADVLDAFQSDHLANGQPIESALNRITFVGQESEPAGSTKWLNNTPYEHVVQLVYLDRANYNNSTEQRESLATPSEKGRASAQVTSRMTYNVAFQASLSATQSAAGPNPGGKASSLSSSATAMHALSCFSVDSASGTVAKGAALPLRFRFNPTTTNNLTPDSLKEVYASITLSIPTSDAPNAKSQVTVIRLKLRGFINGTLR